MAAVKSALSCVFSYFRPFTGQPLTAVNSSNPASPRTPICNGGRVDSSSTAAAVQQQRVCAASPPVSPFISPVVEGKSVRVIDPASFVIERLDEGWFEDNVVGIEWWWDICTPSWDSCSPEGQPSTGDLMAWVPGSLSDSELFLGSPSGIGTPETGSSSRSSSQQHLFAAIEMVQPLASSASGNSSAADRDPRGLPGSRLRRLPKVFPDDEISLSDGEQKRYPGSLRAQSEDLPEALRRFSERQLEPSPKAKASLRRRKEKHVAEVVEPPRRFSDGEESGEFTSAPVGIVKEKAAVSQHSPNSSSRTSKSHSSSSSKMRSSTEIRRSTSSLEGSGASQKERRRSHKGTSSTTSLPAAPARWRRRDRRKCTKSMTELEYDELSGLTDLGFNFTLDDHTPSVGSGFPSPRFYSREGDEWLHQSPNKSSPRSRMRSPRGGRPKHPESQLLNWPIPSVHDSNVDMKALMKFWAHSVASTVSAEC